MCWGHPMKVSSSQRNYFKHDNSKVTLRVILLRSLCKGTGQCNIIVIPVGIYLHFIIEFADEHIRFILRVARRERAQVRKSVHT